MCIVGDIISGVSRSESCLEPLFGGPLKFFHFENVKTVRKQLLTFSLIEERLLELVSKDINHHQSYFAFYEIYGVGFQPHFKPSAYVIS